MRVGCGQQREESGIALRIFAQGCDVTAWRRQHVYPLLGVERMSVCVGHCVMTRSVGSRESLLGLMRRWLLALLAPGNRQSSREGQSVYVYVICIGLWT